jgi:3-methylcrotonyl-CoA carboxylase alpha subunit
MLRRLLIANRGEIACRIIRSARRLGVETVAVYSEADANAMHVAMADQSVLIGPSPARESYLRIDKLIEAAQRTGADCVHPGYGFLSENAGFAQACADAGIKFVGPSAHAIAAMGSKIDSKITMIAAGVPVVPGYLDAQDDASLAAAAERIGYPVLIKASAGGGGRGMRIVNAQSEFAEALSGARREAISAFGDGKVLIERYLGKPRHIEVQVLADAHGNCVYLFERDCSVQRRHQKVVEEAPAPSISEAMRHDLGQRAVRAAKAIDYEGVGTVEFIVQGDEAYFMEMNTRLQVEHPVTELITGLDLVEWQLRVASGEPLGFRQEDLSIRNHAMEVRVYAENPRRNFLPSSGKLTRLHLPVEREGVRVDTGVREGDTVSTFYDPMIAKVITWGSDRTQAIDRLIAALRETDIVGVENNVGFVTRILDHAEFRAGGVDTGFIARHYDELVPAQEDDLRTTIALAAVARSHHERITGGVLKDGFRMNMARRFHYRLKVEGEVHNVEVIQSKDGIDVDVSGKVVSLAEVRAADGSVQARVVDPAVAKVGDGTPGKGRDVLARSYYAGPAQVVRRRDTVTELLPVDEHGRAASLGGAGSGVIKAPLPGAVLSVNVKVGDTVNAGDTLVVIEAMKMEHSLKATGTGTVSEVRVIVGARVKDGDLLVKIDA